MAWEAVTQPSPVLAIHTKCNKNYVILFVYMREALLQKILR